MSNFSQQLIQEQYKLLPEELKAAIYSSDIAEKIFAIGRNHAITIEQNGFMAEEIAYVVLGLVRPEDLAKNLQERLSLRSEEIDEIVKDINKEIFEPIREGFKTQQQKQKTEETPASQELSPKRISSLREALKSSTPPPSVSAPTMPSKSAPVSQPAAAKNSIDLSASKRKEPSPPSIKEGIPLPPSPKPFPISPIKELRVKIGELQVIPPSESIPTQKPIQPKLNELQDEKTFLEFKKVDLGKTTAPPPIQNKPKAEPALPYTSAKVPPIDLRRTKVGAQIPQGAVSIPSSPAKPRIIAPPPPPKDQAPPPPPPSARKYDPYREAAE